ncbi:hypothetical protein [Tunturiibacter lichenicola]|uniref:hypothetical protein n=1 Tax=Tunturiibacter lichenicola TaxID=2051959 RepID=UPI003D9BA14B
MRRFCRSRPWTQRHLGRCDGPEYDPQSCKGAVADLNVILAATEPASSRGGGFDPMSLGGESMGSIPELHISLVQARPELDQPTMISANLEERTTTS